MSIKLSNFVNINIDYINSLTSSGARDTVAFIESAASGLRKTTLTLTDSEATWESLAEFVNAHDEGVNPVASDPMYPTIACFFNNGGQKIHYVQCADADVLATIQALPTKEIVVCSNMNAADLFAIGYEGTGVEEKMFISSVTSISGSDSDAENCVLKVGNPGCEMTIAAYLSRINIDASELQDYCFTSEVLNNITGVSEVITIIDDNSTFESIKEAKKYNCDIYMIANDLRNYGGNTCGQIDVVNYFTKIMFTQTLTDALIRVLRRKLKYNSISVSLVSATIVGELNRYRDAGFLSFDKVWNKGDVYVTENGNEYLVIANNTALTLGYYLTILPFSSLDATDRAARLLPKIYIYLADSYSVRAIEITGRVF